ncbi:MAG: YbaK/EbsC family protein [Candidatus Paceibacterota bacterium]|jgi:Cys-tRNA(Pro) deacylase
MIIQNLFLDKLKELGIQIDIKEFDVSTKTAEEAARAIGCEINQIAKSIIFNVQEEIVLVIVSGGNKVNEAKMSSYLSKLVKKADADFVKEKTGYSIGGVPPFGHKTEIKTFIDKDLLKYKEIWAAAGSDNTVFKISPEELIKYSKGQIIDII